MTCKVGKGENNDESEYMYNMFVAYMKSIRVAYRDTIIRQTKAVMAESGIHFRCFVLNPLI